MKKLLLSLLGAAAIALPLLAATSTTRLKLIKPADGDTGWGTSMRTNFDIIDASATISPVSLSTGVVGTLPAENLVSTVAYTTKQNIFTQPNSFQAISATSGSVNGPFNISGLTSGQCVQAGANGLLASSGAQCGGSGGAAALGSGMGGTAGYSLKTSSPTSDVIVDSRTMTATLTAGSTTLFTLKPSSVTLHGENIILLQETLQTGASFYVSSGAAKNQFTANKVVTSTLSVLGMATIDNLRVSGASGLTVDNLTSGRCVQAGTGGLLTVAAAACGSGSGTGGGLALQPSTATITISSGLAFSGDAGTSGQVLASQGANTIPHWITASGTGDAVLTATQTWTGGNTFKSTTTFAVTLGVAPAGILAIRPTMTVGDAIIVTSSVGVGNGMYINHTGANGNALIIVSTTSSASIGNITEGLSVSVYGSANGGISTGIAISAQGGGSNNTALSVTAGTTSITSPQGVIVKYGLTAGTATVTGQLTAGTVVSPNAPTSGFPGAYPLAWVDDSGALASDVTTPGGQIIWDSGNQILYLGDPFTLSTGNQFTLSLAGYTTLISGSFPTTPLNITAGNSVFSQCSEADNVDNVTHTSSCGSSIAYPGDYVFKAYGISGAHGRYIFKDYLGDLLTVSSNTIRIPYNINAGSTTGSGLSTCGDSSHALAYTSGTGLFSCQALSGGSGGGGYAMQPTTVTIQATGGGIIASTVTVSSNTILVGATFYADGTSRVQALTQGTSNYAAWYSSTTITPDASTAKKFSIPLTSNVTINIPTNLQDRDEIKYFIAQDAGTRVVILGSGFAFGTGISTVTFSSGGSKEDALGCIYRASSAKCNVVSWAPGY